MPWLYFTHTHSPLPLTKLSSLIHFPLLRYPIPPCVRETFISSSLNHLVSHYTDPPIYVFPLALAFPDIINNKQGPATFSMWKHYQNQFHFHRCFLLPVKKKWLLTSSPRPQTCINMALLSHKHSPLPLTNLSRPVHLPLLKYPVHLPLLKYLFILQNKHSYQENGWDFGEGTFI